MARNLFSGVAFDTLDDYVSQRDSAYHGPYGMMARINGPFSINVHKETLPPDLNGFNRKIDAYMLHHHNTYRREMFSREEDHIRYFAVGPISEKDEITATLSPLGTQDPVEIFFSVWAKHLGLFDQTHSGISRADYVTLVYAPRIISEERQKLYNGHLLNIGRSPRGDGDKDPVPTLKQPLETV